jgi:hypothetical protein
MAFCIGDWDGKWESEFGIGKFVSLFVYVIVCKLVFKYRARLDFVYLAIRHVNVDLNHLICILQHKAYYQVGFERRPVILTANTHEHTTRPLILIPKSWLTSLTVLRGGCWNMGSITGFLWRLGSSSSPSWVRSIYSYAAPLRTVCSNQNNNRI